MSEHLFDLTRYTLKIAELEADLAAARERADKAERTALQKIGIALEHLTHHSDWDDIEVCREDLAKLLADESMGWGTCGKCEDYQQDLAASREREAALAAWVAEMHRFLDKETEGDCSDPDEYPEMTTVRRQTAIGLVDLIDRANVSALPILAARDAKVRRAAKIEELEEGIRWGPRYDESVSGVTASFEWRGYLRDRIAALKAEGGER